MRLSHKLFLVLGVLIVSIAIALAVPAISASADADLPVSSSSDLLPDTQVSAPGYNPNWIESYEGSDEYALFYAYGFADRYGRLNYELPGYSDTERYDLANAYIKYARQLEDVGAEEMRVSIITPDGTESYLEPIEGSDENPEVLDFASFVALYEDSGKPAIEVFLGELLDEFA